MNASTRRSFDFFARGFCLLTTFGALCLPAATVSPKLEQALADAGSNRPQIEKALRDIPRSERAALEFLLENMPRTDLRKLQADYILENVSLAFEALRTAPWKRSIPNEIFLNEILPYANISERRDSWRRQLRDIALPLVKGSRTPSEAAQRLNQKLFPLVKVKYSTQRKRADQSPLESMETGLASCTGLSILLVDACRAVGVPARVAGIPSWVDDRGNHTWVEIWDGQWHFTGAAEPDPNGLDRAWFAHDASLAQKDSPRHAIYAVSFRKTSLPFPMVWAFGADTVSAENVTERYAAKTATSGGGDARLLVKVLSRPGGERVSARVKVSDLSDPKWVKEQKSRDEKNDLNDLASFALSPHHRYRVTADRDGRQASAEVDSDKLSNPLVLALDNAPGARGAVPAACPAPRPYIEPLSKRDERALRTALANYFAAGDVERREWKFPARVERLLEENESAVRAVAWEMYRGAPMHQAIASDFKARQVRFENYLSPYTVKQVGTKPEGGWPLFIALHGGGGAPKEVNDSQWQIMQRYYRDQTNVTGYLYVALRAPNDSWNGFYDVYVYPLVENLIRQFSVFEELNADKIFIMGYSHGGYGAFAIGPKMPDRFASIHSSAAAPTDGETSAKTLRNTIFTFMVGENDHAYGRVERCQAFEQNIQKLRGDRKDIFPVQFELKPGFGHGGLPDRDKIREMYGNLRNPTPRELSWEMTDNVIRRFFWLEVAEPGKGREIDAECRDNCVTLKLKEVKSGSVLLDERLIDFRRPVILDVNGTRREVRVRPDLKTLCRTLMERGDPGLAFSCELDF